MIIQSTVLFLLITNSLGANEKNISHKKQQNADKRNDNGQTQQKRGLYGIEPVEILSAPPLPSFASYASSTPVPLEYSSIGHVVKSTSPYPEVIIKPSSTLGPHPHLSPYDEVHSSPLPPISSTPLLPPHPISLHPQVKEITITKEVPVPYYVHVEKKIPYPVYIQVPHPYPVTVEKHVPYEVRVPVEHPVPVPVPKPYPVHVEKHIPYPYPVRVPVDRPYPVHVPVEKPVPYPVRVLVDRPVPVLKHYPVPVEKHVPVPVPYEKHHYYQEEPVKPYYNHANKYPWPPIFKRNTH